MTRADMDRVRDEYVAATGRAHKAGVDLVEVHMAHGYLLSSFLSPLANRRTDDRHDGYGGSLENRMRFPLAVDDAARAAWPAAQPIAVRITASDWLDDDGGQTIADSIAITQALAARGLDLIDVSSGGNVPDATPDYGRMYQVPFADAIRHAVDIPVMTVGAIQGDDHVNTVLAAGRADLCALARPHLEDPHLTLRAANERGYADQAWPPQYLAAKRVPHED
jgi:anthraniloyl-CoA monooxygenase